ncbi:MAG: hypothetical protein Q8O61_13945, partial [Nocardioides sp.]|nr:hypothetical protein [Nocardioides sp.]
RDLPEYGEVGHGPWCSGLPNPPVPIGPNSFKDGSDLDDNPPTSDFPAIPLPGLSRVEADAAAQRGFGAGMSSGYAGSEAEQAIVNAMLAGESGKPVDSYGSLGSLLYGPVLQGGDR